MYKNMKKYSINGHRAKLYTLDGRLLMEGTRESIHRQHSFPTKRQTLKQTVEANNLMLEDLDDPSRSINLNKSIEPQSSFIVRKAPFQSEERKQDKIILEHNENTPFPLNIILYGPPGTGKTYHTINYALAIIEDKSIEDINKEDRNKEDRKKLLERFNDLKQKGQIEFITFHQSYSYEDFIQGIRPDVNNKGGLSFQREDGLFKKIADRALKDYKEHKDNHEDPKNYVIIIDEINRANISRVFGELITLIEKDKRYKGSNELSATLPSGESFTVPPNLYIIGTVNTADKSIALLDLALRRRFEFIKMYPDPSLVIDKYRGLFKNLNEEISSKKGPDFQIGQSYFMPDENNSFNLKDAMNKRVVPLLYEYFMNDGGTVNEIMNKSGITTRSVMGLYEYESYNV